MPSLGRLFLVVVAATLAWRVRLQASWPLAAVILVVLGALVEVRLVGRLARTGLEPPPEPPLATARPCRLHAVWFGGAALLLWLLSRPAWLGAFIRLDAVFCLLAVAWPSSWCAVQRLVWPEAAAAVSRAWRTRVAPSLVARLAGAGTLAVAKCALTEGRPRFAGLHPLRPGGDEPRLLTIAAALLRDDLSPAARAVLEAAAPAELEEYEPLPGLGARGRVDGADWFLGSRPLAAQLGHPIDASPALLAAQVSGGSVWVLLDEQGPAAWLEVADPLRADLATLLDGLRSAGPPRLVLLSQDEPEAAERLRRELGFDEAVARCAPERLCERIEAWRADGPVAVAAGAGWADALDAADLAIPSDRARRLSAPFLAAGAAQRRARRLARRLLPLSIMLGLVALAGPPIVVMVLLDELLLLSVLAGFARRSAGG